MDDMLSDGQGFVATDKVNGLSSHGQSLVGCFHPYNSVKIEDGVAMADTNKMVSQVIN